MAAAVPQTCYFICTAPRSGSWLLAEGLESTRLAGSPREWFQAEVVANHCQKWGIPLCDAFSSGYRSALFDHTVTPNGLFGIKVMYYHFAALRKHLADGGVRTSREVAALAGMFPGLRYIWLQRRDRARQAISHCRAAQTKQWWRIGGKSYPTQGRGEARPRFDARMIERLERKAIQFDRNWEAYFNENGITPLTIFYEDFAADYADTIAGVLKWLGVAVPQGIAIPAPRLVKQADGETEQWLLRYVQYRTMKEELKRARAALQGLNERRGQLRATVQSLAAQIRQFEIAPILADDGPSGPGPEEEIGVAVEVGSGG